MITMTETFYKCEYCHKYRRVPKIWESGYLCKDHERKCYFNPARRSCATCKSLVYASEPNPERPKIVYLVRQCKNGIDITSRMRTKCEAYNYGVKNEELICDLDD